MWVRHLCPDCGGRLRRGGLFVWKCRKCNCFVYNPVLAVVNKKGDVVGFDKG